jgi:hypothetical protein
MVYAKFVASWKNRFELLEEPARLLEIESVCVLSTSTIQCKHTAIKCRSPTWYVCKRCYSNPPNIVKSSAPSLLENTARALSLTN